MTSNKIIVAGMGPGAAEWVLPASLAAVSGAHFLAGGRRLLHTFAREGQETFPITGQLALLENWIKESLQEDHVVIMVSGDPGFYSLLPWIRKHFHTVPIEVLPGISSMQLAFARLGMPWQEASWMSFHGRIPSDEKLTFEKGRVAAFLTDSVYHPGRIAEKLLSLGWPAGCRAAALERLSYEDEKIWDMSLEDMSWKVSWKESVLVVFG
jgi:cobalt-precorrin-7 (C5)-methyltransferase